MALSILVPMSTSSLMSMPRFALVLFPMFAILAPVGSEPTVNNAIVAFSLPLLGLFTVLFADWYWVAMSRSRPDTRANGLAHGAASVSSSSSAIVGASGFVVNLVVFTLLQRSSRSTTRPTRTIVIFSIAFLSGGVSNYFLNRVWTFRSSGHALAKGSRS